MNEGASEARLSMLDADAAAAAAEAAGIPVEIAGLSVFRVLLRQPRLAGSMYSLLSTLLWKGSLDPRLRELVIMRIGWRTGSEYEWTQHWRVARQLDVAEADLLAVRDWRAAAHLGPAEQAALAATDETIDTGAITAATWNDCAAHLSDDELLELVVAIGNWRMFSSLLRSIEVPLEDGVDPWPPDGAAPASP